MAMLLDSIATSGVRRSDGTPAASGFVFLYLPGTTTLVSGYRDNALSQTWTTTNGGIQLDASGRATIWVGQKVDVVINDASGAVVATLLGYNGIPAPVVEVQNPGYTGAITDPATGNVTQGAGGLTDLDTVLSRLAASVGGPDGQYQESSGATPRPVFRVIREIHVTPQDFKAAGNGLVDDTQAILNAITELGRLGSGVLYLPPGTYKYSSLLQVGLNSANATGISIIGAGSGASILSGPSGLLVYSTRARLEGFSLNGGGGLDIENASNVIVEDITTDALCLQACKVGGSSTEVMLRSNKFAAVNSNALSAGLVVSGATNVRAIGNYISGGSSGVGLWGLGDSPAGGWLFDGNTFANCGLAGVVFQGGLSTFPSGVSLINSPSLSSLSVPILPLATTYRGNGAIYPSNLLQQANGLDGETANILSGGTYAPLYSKGTKFRIKGTTTGSAYNVSAPDVVASNVPRDTVITITFVNAAGGAVTGWTLDAIYKTTASIPLTDGHSIQVQFLADPNGSGFGGNWREIARSDTTT